MVAWVRDNSIHIRPFALKGWLMFLLLSLPVECAFVGVRLKPSSSSCLFSYIEYAFHRRAKTLLLMHLLSCYLYGMLVRWLFLYVCRWFANGLMAYLHIGCFIISGWQNIMGINTMLTYIFSYLYSRIALKFLQHYFIRYIIFLAFLSDLVMKKTILAWPVFRSFSIYDFFAVWEEALGYILLVSCSMKLILVKSGFRGILMGKKFGIQKRVRAIFSAFSCTFLTERDELSSNIHFHTTFYRNQNFLILPF